MWTLHQHTINGNTIIDSCKYASNTLMGQPPINPVNDYFIIATPYPAIAHPWPPVYVIIDVIINYQPICNVRITFSRVHVLWYFSLLNAPAQMPHSYTQHLINMLIINSFRFGPVQRMPHAVLLCRIGALNLGCTLMRTGQHHQFTVFIFVSVCVCVICLFVCVYVWVTVMRVCIYALPSSHLPQNLHSPIFPPVCPLMLLAEPYAYCKSYSHICAASSLRIGASASADA